MKFRYLGHSAFLLTASDGTRIITDPYEPNAFRGAIRYGAIVGPADFVTVSHDHSDHNYLDGIAGNPQVIYSAGVRQAGAVRVSATPTFHDATEGKDRGENLVFLFEDAGLRVLHCGDLGHVPAPGAIGPADVLLVPVGGYFTIGPDEAFQVAGLVGARIIIPMHFATGKTKMPIVGVEEFIKGRENVNVVDGSDTELTAATLPGSTQIRVLKHAL
jgi:L-ascorbate metabolism protein UlaG (beta-lactamase superfamily)